MKTPAFIIRHDALVELVCDHVVHEKLTIPQGTRGSVVAMRVTDGRANYLVRWKKIGICYCWLEQIKEIAK